eukprot:351759-Lingulodinium_polyedra.AAC.1
MELGHRRCLAEPSAPEARAQARGEGCQPDLGAPSHWLQHAPVGGWHRPPHGLQLDHNNSGTAALHYSL